MLDDDRFESSTSRAAGVQLAGPPLRDLPRTGSVIGAIVRDGPSVFPHGDDVLRPGDRVIVFVESRRAAGRDGCWIRRAGRRRRRGLDLVGGVLKWLGAASSSPAWSRSVRRAVLAVPGRRRDHRPGRPPLDQLTARARAAVTPREGFLVVALIWLLVPIFGALPFLLAAAAALHPVDAYFEAVSGFTATGATFVPHIERLAELDALLAPAQPLARRHGIIVLAVAVLPRLRIGGRQLLQSELAGPTEIERFGTRSARPRGGSGRSTSASRWSR